MTKLTPLVLVAAALLPGMPAHAQDRTGEIDVGLEYSNPVVRDLAFARLSDGDEES